MSEQNVGVNDFDLKRDTIDSAEYERDIFERFPGAVRLIEATARRKRLLKALAAWRGAHPAPKGRTQGYVAEKIRSTQEAISRLELGKVDPRLSTLERYAAALDANFLWQVVDDKGAPVSADFTWPADVVYRSENPALPHAAGAASVGSAGPVATSPEREPHSVVEMSDSVTAPVQTPPALKKVSAGSMLSPEHAWDIPYGAVGTYEEAIPAEERVLLEV
jgi:DNA-binding XRE family transcriptional regulator